MLLEIFQALAEQLQANITMPTGTPELHVEPAPFPIAEAPNINMVLANPTGLEEGVAGFHQLHGGIPITVTFRVPSGDIISATELALAFMDADGPMSILAAIDADHTLGGVVSDIGWGDGFPWAGFTDFPTPDGNGVLLGSRLTIIVLEKSS